MNIGYGLAALDSYYKEGDARKERDYVQTKRDAELSTLGDKTDADRSGYQLRSGQNRADTELLPYQTANAKKRLGLDATSLAADAERQPDEIKTKSINAKIGLANAENDQANVPASLAVKNNALQTQLQTSDATLKQLPMKLQQLATQGVLDQRGQGEVVLGTMGQLIARQDKARALAFANDIAKVGNILPNTNGKTFTDIVPVRKGQDGAQGDGYIFHTSDGGKVFTPVEAISGAMQKLKSGEYQFIHTNDGSVYSGNKSTGAVTQVYQGDPKINSLNKMGPMERDVGYLVSAHGMTQQQALQHLNSAKTMSREQFILKSAQDFISMGKKPTEQEIADFGALYDRAQRTQQQQNPRPGGPNLNPTGTNWSEWTR